MEPPWMRAGLVPRDGRYHTAQLEVRHETIRLMPSSEAARLAALRGYRILDTEPERAFDDLTLLASQICGTPIALITLVDAHRQWFKSRVGVTITETSRSIAFCSHAIDQRDLFVILDTLNDTTFRDNPLV